MNKGTTHSAVTSITLRAVSCAPSPPKQVGIPRVPANIAPFQIEAGGALLWQSIFGGKNRGPYISTGGQSADIFTTYCTKHFLFSDTEQKSSLTLAV